MKLARPVTHVIYDLDGVLLDTECFYTEVTQEIVAPYGKTFDWAVKSRMIGRPSIEAARFLVETLELPFSAEHYLEKRKRGLEQRFPLAQGCRGAERFTRELHARGVPQAIATSSERAMFDLKKTHHGDWFSVFASAVTGDDPRVARGKPAPDIFLRAAADIGADADLCVVFEDSPAGVEAAHAAGMQCVAIPDPAMDLTRYRLADLVVESFDDLTPADLGL